MGMTGGMDFIRTYRHVGKIYWAPQGRYLSLFGSHLSSIFIGNMLARLLMLCCCVAVVLSIAGCFALLYEINPCYDR